MKDRKEWKALVHMKAIKLKPAIFALPCVLSDLPPIRSGGLAPGEEWDAVT